MPHHVSTFTMITLLSLLLPLLPLSSSLRVSAWVRAQSCPTLWSMDCSLSGSSVHGIHQARILECVVILPPGESSQPKAWTCVSCVGRWILYQWAIWEAVKCLESESHSVMSDSLGPHGLYSPWNSPGQNIGVGSFSLLQGIFPIQGSNPGLPHCRQILYQLSHKGSPACPFSRGSSQPGNWTRISCIAGGFFTSWAIRDPCYLPSISTSEQSLGVWLPSPSLSSHPYCACPQINLWKQTYTILLFTEIFCGSPLLTNQILTISRLSEIFFPFK